ncbi:MAG: hypothetical protein ACR2O6_06360 [Ilumatobacteraceae bacterium]
MPPLLDPRNNDRAARLPGPSSVDSNPMIAWGCSPQRRVVDSGVFYSPAAGCDAPYELVETRRWLTVGLLHLWPLGDPSTHVECQRTGAAYDTEVLDALTDAEVCELMPLAIRAAVAAIALADDVVSDAERRAAIAVVGEFVEGYDDVDFEYDLEDVGIVHLEELLAALSTALTTPGCERLLSCVAHVMAASGPASELTVKETYAVGRALGMSDAHIDGVVLRAESLA